MAIRRETGLDGCCTGSGEQRTYQVLVRAEIMCPTIDIAGYGRPLHGWHFTRRSRQIGTWAISVFGGGKRIAFAGNRQEKPILTMQPPSRATSTSASLSVSERSPSCTVPPTAGVPVLRTTATRPPVSSATLSRLWRKLVSLRLDPTVAERSRRMACECALLRLAVRWSGCRIGQL